MTKYKLVIPTKGIMILVLWEESFKSLEADYSNHLASPLVASCGEISPSPRIRCDKIKSPTRDAVLGHLETGHPKNRTQCGVTHPLKLWQNHLNYPGSSAQAITIKVTLAQTHFKRNNSGSVG